MIAAVPNEKFLVDTADDGEINELVDDDDDGNEPNEVDVSNKLLPEPQAER